MSGAFEYSGRAVRPEERIGALQEELAQTRQELAHTREAWAQADWEGTHDPLTGMPNRRGWDRAIEPLRSIVLAGGKHAVGVGDLDGTKDVNDGEGHPAGDELIIGYAGTIAANTRHSEDRPPDIAAAARSGGDETWILWNLEGGSGTPEERAHAAAGRLEKAFDAYLEGTVFQRYGVGVSIGIAVAREGATVEELVEEADQAAHQKKLDRLPQLSPEEVERLDDAICTLDELGISLRRAPLYAERFLSPAPDSPNA